MILNDLSSPTGYVEQCSKLELSGWVAHKKASKLPMVTIVQGGDIVCVLRPHISASNVISSLNLDPKTDAAFRWKLPFPLLAGLNAGKDFNIIFEDGTVLEKGRKLHISLIENIDPDAKRDLEQAKIMLPASRPEIDGESFSLSIAVLRNEKDPVTKVVAGDNIFTPESSKGRVMGLCTDHVEVRLKKSELEATERNFTSIRLATDKNMIDERQKFHQKLRTIWIPNDIFSIKTLRPPVPASGNIVRVSGEESDLRFVVGGTTTFIQLNEISKKYFNVSLGEYQTCVDWGCGCARVMRQFWEAGKLLKLREPNQQRIIGVDIDPVNINWCKENMDGRGNYKVLSLEGFDFNTAEIDLLYGISVMTHLTEHHQNLWLNEIARVVRPGGCVILTTHGEFAYYRHSRMLATAFVERFGIFDLTPDAAIGADKDTYYRATFHSREYIKKYWSKNFEILDVIPVANAFHQDFIVMRRL